MPKHRLKMLHSKYDEIPFFKISAKYVMEIIQKHTQKKNLQVLDVACGTGNVVSNLCVLYA